MLFKPKKSINHDNLPKCVAIIMDGNGRWAKKHLLPIKAGHRQGAQALRTLSEKMNNIGYKNLIVYTFSTENWTRSTAEVEGLMDLLREYFEQYINDSAASNIKITVIGDITRFAPDVQEKINKLVEITKNYDGMQLVFALNYGGRDEITRTAKKIAIDIAENKITPDMITEEMIADYLDTKGIPDPDIIIRTSGEMRYSNFLLWQIAYSELFFIKKLWPDFTIDDLSEIIIEFQSRNRRLGGR